MYTLEELQMNLKDSLIDTYSTVIGNYEIFVKLLTNNKEDSMFDPSNYKDDETSTVKYIVDNIISSIDDFMSNDPINEMVLDKYYVDADKKDITELSNILEEFTSNLPNIINALSNSYNLFKLIKALRLYENRLCFLQTTLTILEDLNPKADTAPVTPPEDDTPTNPEEGDTEALVNE